MATIMVVDDSTIMRKKLIKILEGASHKIVAEASDGKRAFTEYEKSLPDIITMDITMPQEDGISSMKRIIAKYPKAKIIMISAMSHMSFVYEAINAGAKHFIIKPFEDQKVINIIEAVLKM